METSLFLADPVEFLLSRGVETIVFIGAGNGGEEQPPEAPPEVSPHGDEERPPKLDVSNLPDDDTTRTALSGENAAHASNPNVRCKTDQQTAQLSGSWRFRFFHKKENLRNEIARLIPMSAPRATADADPLVKRAAAFLDAVETVQRQRNPTIRNPMLDQPALVNAIRDKDARSAVKTAYGKITALENDVSLVMWHGPVRFAGSYCQSDVFGSRASDAWWLRPYWRANHRKNGRSTTGTMLTGDLNLKNKLTKAALLQHYTVSLPDTAFFYLPHHGSHENWKADATVLASDPNCLVSAGLRSKYGHPHLDVVDELENKFDLPVFWSHERSAVTLRIRCWQ